MPRSCSSGPIRATACICCFRSSRVSSLRRMRAAIEAASPRGIACSARSTRLSTSPMPSRRDTSRSGRNGSRSSSRSPVAANTTGTPTTDTTDSAAPPRASPSSFVSTTPVTPSRWLNSPALRTASCPVMASATNSRSEGVTASRMATTSRISSSSTWRRPAVSTSTTSKPSCRASDTADVARRTGSPAPASCTRNPASRPRTASCSMAAGRRTSVETRIGCRPWPVSQRPSFAVVVVLPDPCRPASSTTCGRSPVVESPARAAPNSRSSSSRTMATTCWDGVRLSSTSRSVARSRTRSTNALTTLKLTSASSSARRISRSVRSTASGVSRTSRRNAPKTSCKREPSAWNIRRSAPDRTTW